MTAGTLGQDALPERLAKAVAAWREAHGSAKLCAGIAGPRNLVRWDGMDIVGAGSIPDPLALALIDAAVDAALTRTPSPSAQLVAQEDARVALRERCRAALEIVAKWRSSSLLSGAPERVHQPDRYACYQDLYPVWSTLDEAIDYLAPAPSAQPDYPAQVIARLREYEAFCRSDAAKDVNLDLRHFASVMAEAAGLIAAHPAPSAQPDAVRQALAELVECKRLCDETGGVEMGRDFRAWAKARAALASSTVALEGEPRG